RICIDVACKELDHLIFFFSQFLDRETALQYLDSFQNQTYRDARHPYTLLSQDQRLLKEFVQKSRFQNDQKAIAALVGGLQEILKELKTYHSENKDFDPDASTLNSLSLRARITASDPPRTTSEPLISLYNNGPEFLWALVTRIEEDLKERTVGT